MSDSISKHEDLAHKILENLKNEDNKINEKESHGAYNANLPEGVTPQTVEAISKYNGQFVSAAHIAIGKMAADVFAKNKKIDEIEASVGFFGKDDSIDVNVLREQKFTNNFAKEGEDKEVVKPLFMQTTVTVKCAKGIGLKSIKDELGRSLAPKFQK